jgi:hypothetical protein
MAKYQTKLSEEINEDILEFMAGKGDGDTPYQLQNESTESELNEVKRVLVYVMREIAVLSDSVRKEHATNLKEFKDLRDCMMEIKEEIKELKGRIPESNSQAYPLLVTNNRNDSNQNNTVKTNERERENKEILLVSKFSVDNYLSHSEFPLPLFDENSVNPVWHLKQLDNYIKLKNIPAECRLAVAYRSLSGVMSKQWAETIISQLNNYETFKQEFLSTWWSIAQQSLVKCSLYQDKYNKQSNLSLSAHFFKYATMASYLDPKPSDTEIIEAIRYHYPLNVQRAMLNIQIRTISEALDQLKRIELVETREQYNKSQSRRFEQARNMGVRNQGQAQIRRIQRQSNSGYDNDYRPHRRNCYEIEEENEISNTRSKINDIQMESRDYNKESRTMSLKLYTKRYSEN